MIQLSLSLRDSLLTPVSQKQPGCTLNPQITSTPPTLPPILTVAISLALLPPTHLPTTASSAKTISSCALSPLLIQDVRIRREWAGP